MNANQPAYPCVWYDFQPTAGEQVVREHFGGLTKRELIAAMALQAILTNADLDEFTKYLNVHAEMATEAADKLILKLLDTEYQ